MTLQILILCLFCLFVFKTLFNILTMVSHTGKERKRLEHFYTVYSLNWKDVKNFERSSMRNNDDNSLLPKG